MDIRKLSRIADSSQSEKIKTDLKIVVPGVSESVYIKNMNMLLGSFHSEVLKAESDTVISAGLGTDEFRFLSEDPRIAIEEEPYTTFILQDLNKGNKSKFVEGFLSSGEDLEKLFNEPHLFTYDKLITLVKKYKKVGDVGAEKHLSEYLEYFKSKVTKQWDTISGLTPGKWYFITDENTFKAIPITGNPIEDLKNCDEPQEISELVEIDYMDPAIGQYLEDYYKSGKDKAFNKAYENHVEV